LFAGVRLAKWKHGVQADGYDVCPVIESQIGLGVEAEFRPENDGPRDVLRMPIRVLLAWDVRPMKAVACPRRAVSMLLRPTAPGAWFLIVAGFALAATCSLLSNIPAANSAYSDQGYFLGGVVGVILALVGVAKLHSLRRRATPPA